MTVLPVRVMRISLRGENCGLGTGDRRKCQNKNDRFTSWGNLRSETIVSGSIPETAYGWE